MFPKGHSRTSEQRRNQARSCNWLLLSSCLLLSVLGCSRSVPRDRLVFTQSLPKNSKSGSASDVLDLRYPAGSRIVIADSAFKHLEILSEGLYSAGDPRVTYDGQHLLFCAKSSANTEWQIYEMNLANRRYLPLTAISGGAASPDLLPDGRLIFVSPVRKIGAPNQLSATLYAQAPGQQPQALTFTTISVSDPCVLDDGRILFVGARRTGDVTAASALYTINNDGTEIAQFSRSQDGPSLIRQPRQISGKRIGYLVSEPGAGCDPKRAEFIRSAQPFAAAESLPLPGFSRLGSMQPLANGELLLSAQASQQDSGFRSSLAIYRVIADTGTPGTPLFRDSGWDSFEPTVVTPPGRPMGRLSTVDPGKGTGQILCLDVNYTATAPRNGQVPVATRVRVTAQPGPGRPIVLGEVPVQADGSFMVEVPADVPLGFEALDDHGDLLRRVAPVIWVRPGENRACVGCHEPPNHAPRNRRPLAVRAPVPKLLLQNSSLAKAQP